MATHRFDTKDFFVEPKSKVQLSKIRTKPSDEKYPRELIEGQMSNDLLYLQEQQDKLFAEAKQSLIVIFQGMDASGKDGCIKHVFSGVNPQGCTAYSFKAPNAEELEHHFLWRPMRYLPARGKIAIFNRSYYEETLVVRVHPEFLVPQRISKLKSTDDLWPQRFEEIKSFEKLLDSHGTKVIKFFLHVSQDEQISRLFSRVSDPDKHWKVNLGDFAERELWPKYQTAFEDMLASTSTNGSPWYIVPADSKWFARALVADIIAQHIEQMDVQYPKVSKETSEKYSALATDLKAKYPTLGDESNGSKKKQKKK